MISIVCLIASASSTIAQTATAPPSKRSIAASDPRVRLIGRYDAREPDAPRFGYPGTGFLVRFRGPSLAFSMASDSDTSVLTLVLDHGEPTKTLLHKGEQTVVAAAGLDAESHTLEVYKRTETWQGVVTLRSLEVNSDKLLSTPPLPERKLLFVGDSVTCGAGIDNDAKCTRDPAHPDGDPWHSFGMTLGRRLDAQVQLVCYGGRGLERDYRGLGITDGVINAPEFLDLSVATDDVVRQSSWNSKVWTPDAVFISLGTNDFNLQSTRPLDGKRFVAEYVAFLRRVMAEYPRASIFTTEGAIITNPLLRQYIREAVGAIHESQVVWVEATHYAGNGCDPHPTRAEHARMADDLEPVLRETLHW